jgi:hypothetical protein
VAHISLVFREMWDTTALFLRLSMRPMHLAVNLGGIPHLAKNKRDVGHPSFLFRTEQSSNLPIIVNILLPPLRIRHQG